jgi:hypothetical protein
VKQVQSSGARAEFCFSLLSMRRALHLAQSSLKVLVAATPKHWHLSRGRLESRMAPGDENVEGCKGAPVD